MFYGLMVFICGGAGGFASPLLGGAGEKRPARILV